MDGEGRTEGVETLLGNPKKAVLAMAIPMAIATTAQMSNNLIDAMWVAGLGEAALAAVGFTFPLFFIMVGIGNGIGVGAASFVSRRIGAGDKEAAEETATQAVFLTLIFSSAFTVLMLLVQKPMLILIGVGDSLDLCLEYTTPMFLFSAPIMTSVVYSQILRAEGAAKLSMKTQILSAVIHIILDPFFIYDFNGFGLGLGVLGASLAMVISMLASFAVLLYFYYSRNRVTYLAVRLRGRRLNLSVAKDILSVGIPASASYMVISLASVIMNLILVDAGGLEGVAVFSTTWRVINMFMVPLFAFSGGMVPVCAAAYGARDRDKLTAAYWYAVKSCAVLMSIITVASLVFAEQIVTIFTYSDTSSHLRPEMASALRWFSVFLPFAAWGFMAEGLFMSLGMGVKSMVTTAVRNVLQIPVSYVMVQHFHTLESIWIGVTASEIVGAVFPGLWSVFVLATVVKGLVPLRRGGAAE
ncbi:MAG: MATE family efflux transporter [Thermoplasmatales archaeon]|nr:MATE family efflux transporter [Thermoplasmatales archaeon]